MENEPLEIEEQRTDKAMKSVGIERKVKNPKPRTEAQLAAFERAQKALKIRHDERKVFKAKKNAVVEESKEPAPVAVVEEEEEDDEVAEPKPIKKKKKVVVVEESSEEEESSDEEEVVVIRKKKKKQPVVIQKKKSKAMMYTNDDHSDSEQSVDEPALPKPRRKSRAATAKQNDPPEAPPLHVHTMRLSYL